LAEDENHVRIAATRILTKDGYTVLEAAHGDEALQVCEEHEGPIHLMIADLVMPGVSGRELAERFAVTRPDAKVLFMSGYTTEAVALEGILDGGFALLQKPFSSSELLLSVREVLDAQPE
jgi:CheY-like chemotaxis protein